MPGDNCEEGLDHGPRVAPVGSHAQSAVVPGRLPSKDSSLEETGIFVIQVFVNVNETMCVVAYLQGNPKQKQQLNHHEYS